MQIRLKKTKGVKAIIFDYDGTLIDTFDAYYLIASNFQRKNHVKLFSTKNQLMDIMDAGLKELLKHSHVSLFSLPKLISHLKEEMTKVDVTHVTPYPKIKNMLEQQTVPLYVVTSNYSNAVTDHLKYYNMNTYFKLVLGADQSTSKIAKIKRVCKQLKCTPSQTVFVSDTSSDIKEANKAGCTTIAVTYGYGNPKKVEQAKPDYYAHSVDELQKILTLLQTQ